MWDRKFTISLSWGKGIAALLVLLLALQVFSFVQINSTSQNNCQQVELVKGQLRVTLDRSLKTIPTLSYYREHPSEMRLALSQVRQTLVEFKPSGC